jgi:hypothetical protein
VDDESSCVFVIKKSKNLVQDGWMYAYVSGCER